MRPGRSFDWQIVHALCYITHSYFSDSRPADRLSHSQVDVPASIPWRADVVLRVWLASLFCGRYGPSLFLHIFSYPALSVKEWTLWLRVFGVNEKRWKDQARATAEK